MENTNQRATAQTTGTRPAAQPIVLTREQLQERVTVLEHSVRVHRAVEAVRNLTTGVVRTFSPEEQVTICQTLEVLAGRINGVEADNIRTLIQDTDREEGL